MLKNVCAVAPTEFFKSNNAIAVSKITLFPKHSPQLHTTSLKYHENVKKIWTNCFEKLRRSINSRGLRQQCRLVSLHLLGNKFLQKSHNSRKEWQHQYLEARIRSGISKVFHVCNDAIIDLRSYPTWKSIRNKRQTTCNRDERRFSKNEHEGAHHSVPRIRRTRQCITTHATSRSFAKNNTV